MCIKDPLPMDVDFVVQDTYALLRPQWKLIADLAEAGKAFGEAVKQNYQSQTNTANDPPTADDAEEADLSDDARDDDDVGMDHDEADKSDGEDAGVITAPVIQCTAT